MPTRERHRGSSIHWIAAALATAMAVDETFDNERPPRTTGDQAHGVRRGSLRSFASRSEVTERNLGLSAQSPMPSGRQLGILRWRHDMNHPPTWLTTIWIWDRCRARQVRQKPKTARFYCGQIDSRMRNRLPHGPGRLSFLPPEEVRFRFQFRDPSEAAAFARAFDGDLLHGPEQIAA